MKAWLTSRRGYASRWQGRWRQEPPLPWRGGGNQNTIMSR